MDKQGKDLIFTIWSIVLFATKSVWWCFSCCLDYSNVSIFLLSLALLVVNEQIYILNIKFYLKINMFRLPILFTFDNFNLNVILNFTEF